MSDFNMLIHSKVSFKRFTANGTYKWSFLHTTSLQMISQSSFLSESSPAPFTVEIINMRL